ALEDGLSVRFHSSGLPNGCVLTTHGDSAPLSLAKLIFDLLVAGSWVARNIATNGESIAHSLDSVRGTRGTFGPTAVVESVEDLQFPELRVESSFSLLKSDTPFWSWLVSVPPGPRRKQDRGC
ncbi:MAG: hypothetical protein K1X47_04575, partial [Cyclobacteriaceae bacterium]|nr:hypothetical protein [Cyclobacteriaceae bacterium]